jgi:hypothetical protein
MNILPNRGSRESNLTSMNAGGSRSEGLCSRLDYGGCGPTNLQWPDYGTMRQLPKSPLAVHSLEHFYTYRIGDIIRICQS